MLFPSLAACALALIQTPSRDDLGPAKALKILYAGAPGDARETHFMEFLRPWFAQVDDISLLELNEKTAAPYDVVIADWKRQYQNGDILDDAEPKAALGATFSKPVILIGSTAAVIQHHSKINWL